MAKYLVVGQHSWSESVFNKIIRYIGSRYEWYYFSGPAKDLPLQVKKIEPDMIFFMHWSYIVPDYIVINYECVCFHPSHLPYGRGGTPVQNLIKRGFKTTKLTAFRMTEDLDAGPIYLQTDLSLEGNAQDIYNRIAEQSAKMIEALVMYDIQPVPQSGEIEYFSRRQPAESRILGIETLEELYDHIRMLSAEDYPHAFIEYGDYVIEFTDVWRNPDCLLCSAVITKKEL